VPTYGSPWSFVLAAGEPIAARPDPASIDRLLAERTTGGLRMLDGLTLAGLLCTPAHIRRAVEQETRVYTLADPPTFFGAAGGQAPTNS
jgi:spermidine synthase